MIRTVPSFSTHPKARRKDHLDAQVRGGGLTLVDGTKVPDFYFFVPKVWCAEAPYGNLKNGRDGGAGALSQVLLNFPIGSPQGTVIGSHLCTLLLA